MNKLLYNSKSKLITLKINQMVLLKINKSFGSQVKYYRSKNNIKQTKLASMLNVAREVILILKTRRVNLQYKISYRYIK